METTFETERWLRATGEASRVRRFRVRTLFTLLLTTSVSWSTLRSYGVEVEDAFARGSGKGQRWEIGTAAVHLGIEAKDGRLYLTSFKNKLCKPAREYADQQSTWQPLSSGGPLLAEKYAIQEVWAKHLPLGVTVAPENLRLTVRKGDMIGFAVGPHGSYYGDEAQWPVTLDHGDGAVYSSTEDTRLEQGPVWYYCVGAQGTGFLDFMDAVEKHPTRGESMRIPSGSSGYRAPEPVPHVGPTLLHPSFQFDAVRVWKAPKDGTVSIRGAATAVSTGDVDLRIIQIKEKTGDVAPAKPEEKRWDLARTMPFFRELKLNSDHQT